MAAWICDLRVKKKPSALTLGQGIKILMIIKRAEDEARTRDLQLGKLSLYQLSYFRKNSSDGKCKAFNADYKIFSSPAYPYKNIISLKPG